MANRHTLEDLRYLQAMPLDLKVMMTKQRIREWIREFGEDGVYVAFSGGKDSTVLLDIVRQDYPNVRAMFVDVPTQYPELKAFVKTFDNVDIVAPKISFMQVCEKYGFPLISKEVSECVQGARKYLCSVAENSGGGYSYRLDKLCGQGEFAKDDRGGYDRKYRRVRGIGEFGNTNGRNSTGQGNSHRTQGDREPGELG